MRDRVLLRFGNDRDIQATADHCGDILEGHALICNCVEWAALAPSLERDREQTRRIEPVDAGPTIEAFAHVRGHALLASQFHQDWNEAMVAVAVYGRRKPNRRRAYAASGGRKGGRFGHPREVRRRSILFCPEGAFKGERHSRGDDERTAGTLERGGKSFDGTAILGTVFGKPLEVVIEGGVNHPIGFGSAAPESIQLIQRPVTNFGTGCGERCRA